MGKGKKRKHYRRKQMGNMEPTPTLDPAEAAEKQQRHLRAVQDIGSVSVTGELSVAFRDACDVPNVASFGAYSAD